MEDNSNYNSPIIITLDKNEYSLKDFLTNDYYSYRCKHRQSSKITIKNAKLN